MRLLLLTPEFDGWGGGIMTFYRDLLPALVEAGVSVHVIEGSALHAANGRNRRSVNGITVETLERSGFESWWNRLSAYEALPLLRRHLAAAWAMWQQAGQGEGFDIVEACDWGLLFVPPVIEAKLPCIVQCHGSVGQIAVHDPVAGEDAAAAMIRLIERTVMAKAAGVQSYGAANASYWSRETGGGVSMIRPGWRNPVPEATSGTSVGNGIVFGRVQRWKGPQVLASALAKLGPSCPQIDWYGRDTTFERTGRMTSAWLADTYPAIWGTAIRHHAPVSPSEVAALQAAAKFNIVPSTWDVFNFTGAEAMASGRPAIISDGAGVSELVTHGETGFVFRSGDASSLAAVLDELMHLQDRRMTEIGAAGRASVATALDPQASAMRRKAAYAQAIAGFAGNSENLGSLAEIARPIATTQRPFAFLDAFPLRGLARHVLRRALGKLPVGSRMPGE